MTRTDIRRLRSLARHALKVAYSDSLVQLDLAEVLDALADDVVSGRIPTKAQIESLIMGDENGEPTGASLFPALAAIIQREFT